MSLRDDVRRVRDSIKTVQAPLPHREECEKWAEAALRACSEWFGPPRDPRCRYVLGNSGCETSGCGYWMGQYNIYLTDGLDTPQERCATVAHEIYHRTTMRRGGLLREPWVDEMLAFFASQWFLRQQGFGDYAQHVRKAYGARRMPIDVAALRSTRRTVRWKPLALNLTNLSEEFYNDVARLGIALNVLVDSGALTKLPWADSLDAWVDTLPADRRAMVRRLLQLPDAGDLPMGDAEAHSRMGNALRYVGRLDESLAEHDVAVCLQPDAGRFHFARGFTLKYMGRVDQARDAWEEAARLDPANADAPFNIASIYAHRKAYGEAIPWYREAVRRKPDWNRALYRLGAACAIEGHVKEGRACWQKIVDGGDNQYAEAARGSLAKWADTAEDDSGGDGDEN